MDRSRRPAQHESVAIPGVEHDSPRALRATIERAPIGIAHFNVAGRFLLVNDRLCRILGHSRAELLSTTFQSITHPDDLEDCVRQTERVASGELPCYTQVKRFVDADGREVWTRVSVSAVRDPAGAMDYFIGVAEDVTQQRAAEDALRAREEMNRVTANALRVWLEAIESSLADLGTEARDAAKIEAGLRKVAAGIEAMRRLLDAVPGTDASPRPPT